MIIIDFQQIINSVDYNFIRNNEYLGDNIILLNVGGSYSYGTNIDGQSDIDIRGITLENPNTLIGLRQFEQFQHKSTDTVIYSFNKIIKLLLNCNPNIIEMLGCNIEHYLYINGIGQLLLDNKDLFITQKCIKSFQGYANSQLYKLKKITKDNIKDVNKINKHAMHCVRLYLMCIDILEKGKIITYRKDEHNLLMAIRNGCFMDSDKSYHKSFFDIVDEYDKKLNYAKEHTNIPVTPDYDKVEELVMQINYDNLRRNYEYIK